VLEGPIPDWKCFGRPGTGNGAGGTSYGLPRFSRASFLARFPFGEISLEDDDIPLAVSITGWSPFIPGDADNSSLPVGAFEYTFSNPTDTEVEAVFSFNTQNFMTIGSTGNAVLPIQNGFILWQDGTDNGTKKAENEGGFAIFVDDQEVVVDHCWFKGKWWDALTLAWRNVQEGIMRKNPPVEGDSPGASLFVPFKLEPGSQKTIRLMFAWYVPNTGIRLGSSSGPAFNSGPSEGAAGNQSFVSGFLGSKLVNTYDPDGDGPFGKLTSPLFEIKKKYIHFLIGGGYQPGLTCINLKVDDEVVRTTTGNNSEYLVWESWDVSKLQGKSAMIQIIDESSASWGHINIDHIVMSDKSLKELDEGDEQISSTILKSPDVTLFDDFESDNFGDWIISSPAKTGDDTVKCCESPEKCTLYEGRYYVPWYAGKFVDIQDISEYWRANYDDLRKRSALFRDTFYDSSLPAEVIEAVAANLTILKSPTILRQTDGRLWCFEGCSDDIGCCHGSCTHVWNYAQALPHLFPDLERTLRETEFYESQDEAGHQQFRSCLPIRPSIHNFYAAADGQLGGIMKIHREWRVSGDTAWLKAIWPRVRQSLDYCITTWDPRSRGVLEEPHHNTYDIEYWGPDGHCTSFYLGALAAAVRMGEALGEDIDRYRILLMKGRIFLEWNLYNGEYFYQKIVFEGLDKKFEPLDTSGVSEGYSDVVKLLNQQGPRYQYGTGCLSDGVIGFWMARMCGLDDDIVDQDKVRSNLKAIHKYNLKADLSDHANPQRPAFAMGDDRGLLLCTWPHGNALAIPFVYSNEVWTGIEYQVASHLMLEGMVKEGLEIVRYCRDRYDGVRRNPFNEYECGHWYARALSSYGLIQGLTGLRYDAVEKTLYIDSKVGDNFRAFLATATGYATAGLKNGKPFIDIKSGNIEINKVLVSGTEKNL
jgi:uncharacterized protein (DUF608 family)